MTVSNTLLNPSIIAREALRLLNNNLVLGTLVNRAYEDEWAKRSNGNKVGATVNIRRPARYTYRRGNVASQQNTQEAEFPVTVGTQAGVDLQFSSADMTLKISEFSDRYLKSAMITIANGIDQDIATTMLQWTHNWVGTPGHGISTYAGFAAGLQRLDEVPVPQAERCAVLSPADKWSLVGAFTNSVFSEKITQSAINKARIPEIGGVDAFMTQNAPVLTTGTHAGTPVVNGANQNTLYTASGGTNTQTLVTNGWTASTVGVAIGDVFTLPGVFAVNQVTGQVLPYLKQFVVAPGSNTTADGAGNLTLTISPAIIVGGAYATVSAAPANSAALTFLGAASTSYTQNFQFHRDAFALVMVPMELPSGAYQAGRESYNGLSVRLIPFYDGTNDLDNWRLDVLYGVTPLYADLSTRVSGT